MNSTRFRTSAPYRTTWCGGADHHINKGNGSVGAVWRGHKKTAPKSGSCGVANMSPHHVWLNLLPQIYTQVRNLSTHFVGGPPNRAGTSARALCFWVDAPRTTALRFRYGHGAVITTTLPRLTKKKERSISHGD